MGAHSRRFQGVREVPGLLQVVGPTIASEILLGIPPTEHPPDRPFCLVVIGHVCHFSLLDGSVRCLGAAPCGRWAIPLLLWAGWGVRAGALPLTLAGAPGAGSSAGSRWSLHVIIRIAALNELGIVEGAPLVFGDGGPGFQLLLGGIERHVALSLGGLGLEGLPGHDRPLAAADIHEGEHLPLLVEGDVLDLADFVAFAVLGIFADYLGGAEKLLGAGLLEGSVLLTRQRVGVGGLILCPGVAAEQRHGGTPCD